MVGVMFIMYQEILNYWVENYTVPTARPHNRNLKTFQQNVRGSYLFCEINYHKLYLTKRWTNALVMRIAYILYSIIISKNVVNINSGWYILLFCFCIQNILCDLCLKIKMSIDVFILKLHLSSILPLLYIHWHLKSLLLILGINLIYTIRLQYLV